MFLLQETLSNQLSNSNYLSNSNNLSSRKSNKCSKHLKNYNNYKGVAINQLMKANQIISNPPLIIPKTFNNRVMDLFNSKE